MQTVALKSPVVVPESPGDSQEKSKVCRALFGPIDHRLTRQFLRHELSEILVKSSREWDFDFSRDVPMRHAEKFSWEQVDPARHPTRSGKWNQPKTSLGAKHRKNSTHRLESRKPSKCLSLLQSTIKDYMPVEKRSSIKKTKRKVLQERRNKIHGKPISSPPKCRLYTDKLRRK